MLLVDSREKWTQSWESDAHLKSYFGRHGIEYKVQKLNVGDYMLEEKPTVTIDRKSNLEELSRNLLNARDSSRFWREVRRCHDQHIKLVILCECGGAVHSINDVPKWKSKYSPVTGRRLVDEMIRLEMSYGVRLVFCDKRSTGRLIMEILEGKT